MLIQIPVIITFDCTDLHSATRAALGASRTFTMRFDTADTSVPASFTDSYPPRDGATWSPDKEGVLFALFTRQVDAAIAKRAEADPESYAVLEDA